jgi:C4-type Zn-finger protein
MATIGSETHCLDIAELERLKIAAERDSVKSLLEGLISKSQKLLERAQELERDQELKIQERQRLDEAQKKREAQLAAQGKRIPEPIGRSKVKADVHSICVPRF